MDEIPKDFINNPGGLLAVFGSFAAGVVVLWRKYWRSEKVNDASADSDVKQIERLQNLLKDADKRVIDSDTRYSSVFALLETERKRADQAFNERNELVRSMGALQQQVETLTQEVKRLQDEIASLKEGKAAPNDH